MSIFTKVAMKKPRYNNFDLSHDRKFSAKMGELIPILLIDTVPGDRFTINASQMLRFAPIIAPLMHHVSVYVHYYFCPNRIVWPEWEDFITGGEDGLDNSVYPFIQVLSFGSSGSLDDYMGLPDTTSTAARSFSALPFAVYQKVYNEYYRDQNLITKVDDELTSGNQSLIQASLRTLRLRAWQHDYFTSALPWTQKGPEATIPLGQSAPIDFSVSGTPARAYEIGGGTAVTGPITSVSSPTGDVEVEGSVGRALGTIDNTADMTVDLSQATAATINDLRQAFRLQEWLEKNARGGSRYVESIKVHFGVRSSDSRLQRPEFLGGGSTPVTISEVLQTSSTDATTPQANMAGHGISVGGASGISYRCEEHGYIIGIMSVMPKTAYQQGIPRHFNKFDKFDYYWPSFAHIGEQPIYQRELYLEPNTPADDDDIFGYIPRYAEYKYMPSTIHGEFRSSLDFWHMGRKFANTPLLNQDFIECDPTTRIFAVPGTEQLYCHVHHNIRAKRPMPYFGQPTI